METVYLIKAALDGFLIGWGTCYLVGCARAWNGGMLFKWKGARPGKCGKNAKKLIEQTHRELAAVKEGK